MLRPKRKSTGYQPTIDLQKVKAECAPVEEKHDELQAKKNVVIVETEHYEAQKTLFRDTPFCKLEKLKDATELIDQQYSKAIEELNQTTIMLERAKRAMANIDDNDQVL